MEHDSATRKDENQEVDIRRRDALRRLGLGLSAIYAVPVLATLSNPAAANGMAVTL